MTAIVGDIFVLPDQDVEAEGVPKLVNISETVGDGADARVVEHAFHLGREYAVTRRNLSIIQTLILGGRAVVTKPARRPPVSRELRVPDPDQPSTNS